MHSTPNVPVCVYEKKPQDTHTLTLTRTHIDNTHTHTQWQQQQCALVPSATDSNTMGCHQAPPPPSLGTSTSLPPLFSQSTANRNYAKLIEGQANWELGFKFEKFKFYRCVFGIFLSNCGIAPPWLCLSRTSSLFVKPPPSLSLSVNVYLVLYNTF